MLVGFNVGSRPAGNSATVYDVDVGQVDEVTFTTSGALGESETAGLVMNVIPKAGGNRTHGSAFASGTAERLQSSNLTPELLAQQVAPVAPLSKVYDLSGTVGGPIATDRLWYFANAHVGGSTRNSTNVYYNRNAGDPGAWRYVPDTTRLSYSDRTFERCAGRLTWQITPPNKTSGFWVAQTICRTSTGTPPCPSTWSRTACRSRPITCT
jgi:hypothetical protein